MSLEFLAYTIISGCRAIYAAPDEQTVMEISGNDALNDANKGIVSFAAEKNGGPIEFRDLHHPITQEFPLGMVSSSSTPMKCRLNLYSKGKGESFLNKPREENE